MASARISQREGRRVEERIATTGEEPTDRELLQRFVATREEAAFQTLVRRYGPMVLGVCRRVVRNAEETDDAFQATFIVLARKASTIAGADSLGGWLYRVAYHAALRVRVKLQRRRGRETTFDEAAHPSAVDASGPGVGAEVRPVLDEELNRLPEKYRAPLVLCYLQGKTTDETAQQLGCPRGTVAWRMSRGRDLLRNRLTRRGLAVTGAAVAVVLTQQSAAQAVAPVLVQSTCRLAVGKTSAGLSAPAYAVADGAWKSMAAFPGKMVAALTLAAAVATAGAVVLAPPAEPPHMTFLNFDAPTPPKNKFGEGYPYADAGDRADVGGLSVDADDAVVGRSLRVPVAFGRFRLHFLPHENGGRRTFARDYCQDPAVWRFDAYDHLRFWIKNPPSAQPHATNGGANMNVCCYIKPARAADGPNTSTDAVGYHHRMNVPSIGCWTQVVLNARPHLRLTGAAEPGRLTPHPTGEAGINYFDALSGLFIEDRQAPKAYPADYRLDEMDFYRAETENDAQVFSITATHIPEQNRIILTWSRPEEEDAVSHEVRFAFSDVHRLGWRNAQPAPGGVVKPPGKGANNGMVFDTTALPLAGRSEIFLAIKPHNADVFSQIVVRLNLR
jgi:RNA polymerase sigma factor (sigma-70 family)